MRFILTQSAWDGNLVEQYLEGSKFKYEIEKEEIKTFTGSTTYTEKVYIEIESLEEFIDMMKEFGHSVVVGITRDDEYLIEIYDDYRE